MYKIDLGSSNFKVPTMAVGCMGINGTDSHRRANYLQFKKGNFA